MWLFLTIFIHFWIWILAEKVHFVHWNSSNPLFYNSISPVIEVTTSEDHWNHEQANIICPFYDKSVPKSLTEQYVVYNVTRDEFFKCHLKDSEQKIVALCNTPYRPNFFTLTFRSFSPTPGAFEFHPGQEYYFISTPPGSRQCSHPPMRLIFRIKNRLPKYSDDDDDDISDNISEEIIVGSPREMPILFEKSGSGSTGFRILPFLLAPLLLM